MKYSPKELYVQVASTGHLGELQVGTSQAPPVGLPEVHALIFEDGKSSAQKAAEKASPPGPDAAPEH